MMNSVASMLKRISDSLQHRGVIRTLMVCVMGILNLILRDDRVTAYRERRFDRKFGVDTAGIIRHDDLNIKDALRMHATLYQATQPALLEKTLAELQIDYQEFTFVDFGCGKGKVLLLASSFPFKKIIGVELAADLRDIARANLKKYAPKKQLCKEMEIVGMDAAEFLIPPWPLVCYFYNPFKEEIMIKVLNNIEQSLNRHPRDVVIVYVYPELDYLLQNRSFLQTVRRRDWCSIYRSNCRTQNQLGALRNEHGAELTA
ncbi:MAG: hypothetical protein HY695_11560 [Deltaproteobacteria bacterium]|nr:hypothetical protein [Deltaproteobacteria bacterium]